MLAARDIVTDDADMIRDKVLGWSRDEAIDVVITTGGTGFTGRDVTPEALEPIFEKRMDGFSEVFHRISYDKIGTSTIQSRATGGVVNATFVFVLPGSPGACRDAWDGILKPQLDYRHKPCNFVEIMPRLDEHLRRGAGQSKRSASRVLDIDAAVDRLDQGIESKGDQPEPDHGEQSPADRQRLDELQRLLGIRRLAATVRPHGAQREEKGDDQKHHAARDQSGLGDRVNDRHGVTAGVHMIGILPADCLGDVGNGDAGQHEGQRRRCPAAADEACQRLGETTAAAAVSAALRSDQT